MHNSIPVIFPKQGLPINKEITYYQNTSHEQISTIIATCVHAMYKCDQIYKKRSSTHIQFHDLGGL